MNTYMVIATFHPDTDMRDVLAVVDEERAHVKVLMDEGRLGSIHISMPRRTVFIETFAADEAAAAATVASLPMSRWWTTDVYPTPAPPRPAVFTAVELEYLATQRLGRLATSQANGTLQNSPVGFTVNTTDGTIDIDGFRLASSQKYRNVLANGRAAFVVDDIVSVEPWRVRCMEIRADAEAIEVDGRPLIRLHPRRVISFGLDEDREAHEMTFHSRDVS